MGSVSALFARAFLDHPRAVGESYPRHLLHAARFGGRMALGAGACFVHALLPFLCTRTGSRIACDLHAELSARTPRAPEPPGLLI